MWYFSYGLVSLQSIWLLLLLSYEQLAILVPLIWVGSIISNRASKVSRSLSLSIDTMSYAHSLRVSVDRPKKGSSPIRQVCMYPTLPFLLFFSFLAPPEPSFPAAPSPLPLLCPWVCLSTACSDRGGRTDLLWKNGMKCKFIDFILFIILLLYLYYISIVAAHVMDILLLYATITYPFLLLSIISQGDMWRKGSR